MASAEAGAKLAREAAVRAIEILNPEDYVGVLTYATDLAWDVEIGPVGSGLSLRRAQDSVSQIQAENTEKQVPCFARQPIGAVLLETGGIDLDSQLLVNLTLRSNLVDLHRDFFVSAPPHVSLEDPRGVLLSHFAMYISI